MLSSKDIVHYGGIISLRLNGHKGVYLSGKGYGRDLVECIDRGHFHNEAYLDSLFLVLPVFQNSCKQQVEDMKAMLAGYNYHTQKSLCEDQLLKLYSEYIGNTEVFNSTKSSTLRFNLSNFMLYHTYSNKFLAVGLNQDNSNSIDLVLVDMPSARTVFKFGNSFKYQIEGENLIFYETPVKLTSSKDIRGLYPKLNCSRATSYTYKANFSLDTSTDLEIVYFRDEEQELKGNYLMGGDIVMFTQLDFNLIISTRGTLDKHSFGGCEEDDLPESVCISSFVGNNSQETIVSTNSLWIIEHPTKFKGEPIFWDKPVRLLNLALNKYLCLESDSRNNGKAILVDLSKSNESTTLFSLVPSGSLVGGSDKVLTNDYISLKGSVLEYYIGYREDELSTLLDVSMRFETRNTFKIIKNSPSSSAICQFQINTFKYLQELSAALVDYKGKREYRASQDLRKQLFPAIKLMVTVRDFVNNRYLISSNKDAYSQRNKTRQDFLSKQNYIPFLSKLLMDLFDLPELQILEELDQSRPEKYQELFEVVTGKVELSTLIEKASFKYKASEKISAEDIMDNVVELLKGKVYLANEVYGLLRDICEKNRANQVQAYGESIYYIVQFQYLQSCNVFFSYLLEECQENAWKLKENFHVGRIKNALPSEEKLIVDVVVRDPGSFLTEHFDEIRRELLREKDQMPNKVKLLNPIIYCGVLLIHSKSDKLKLRVLNFLSAICKVEGRPNPQNQDLIYKMVLLVAEIKDLLFKQFVIENNELKIFVSNEPVPYPKFKAYIPLTRSLGRETQVQHDILLSQFTLLANLGLGRNILWRPFLEELFPPTFLFDAIWNQQYSQMRGIFFNLMINIYINQSPLETIALPQLTRIIAEENMQATYSFDYILRRNLNDDTRLPKKLIVPLLKNLVKDLTSRVTRFFEEISDKVNQNAKFLSEKKEILVSDIPKEILDSVEFINNLVMLNVFSIFDCDNLFQELLKSIFLLFDYNQMYPAQFIMLQEIKSNKENFSITAKIFDRKKKVKKAGGMRVNKVTLEDKMEISLLVGNFYAVKNLLFSNLRRQLASEKILNDLQGRRLIIEMMSKFMDMRQEFLLNNYIEWVKVLGERYSGRKYSDDLVERIIHKCNASVKTILPPVVKTCNKEIDNFHSSRFKKYLGPEFKEFYDLSYLMENNPSERGQSELQNFDTLIPSLIGRLMITEDEDSLIQLMEIILRLFSQRKEMIGFVKKTLLLSTEEERSLHEDVFKLNSSFERAATRIEYWIKGDVSISECNDLIELLKLARTKLLSQISTDEARVNPKAQEVFYSTESHKRILRMFDLLVNLIEEYEEASKVFNHEDKTMVLNVMKDCVSVLSVSVKANGQKKTILMQNLESLTRFHRFDVGQFDLVADIFNDNPGALVGQQKQMMIFFKNLILSEGHQRRFLNFFHSLIDFDEEDCEVKQKLFLDLFLPYNVPTKMCECISLLYGFINSNTEEIEFYLYGTFGANNETSNKEKFKASFVSEPFLYHKEIIGLFIKLLDHSTLSNLVKIQLRKYFSINYLIRFFVEKDNFFEPGYEKVDRETLLPDIEDPSEMYVTGITVLKPIIAELLFKIYCSREKGIYRTLLSSMNILTDLMVSETERFRYLERDESYSTYLSYLLQVLMKIFENKLNSPLDKEDYEMTCLKDLLAEVIRGKSRHLYGALTAEVISTMHAFFRYFHESELINELKANEEAFLKSRDEPKEKISNQILEMRAKQIKIEEITFHDVWELALDELKQTEEQCVREETQTLGKVIHSFSTIFEAAQMKKYGISFKLNDLLKRFVVYLSLERVTAEKKILVLDYLLQYIETSENLANTQDTLQNVKISTALLNSLSSANFEKDKIVLKNFEFLNAMLRGGNSFIQNQIYDYFETNPKETEWIFASIKRYIENFVKYLEDPLFRSSITYDRRLLLAENILKFFQLLCENHNENLQVYLRHQPNLRRSYNFLEIVCSLIKSFVRSRNQIMKLYPLFRISLEFLTEMVQGPNLANQKELIELNLVGCLDTILKWKPNDAKSDMTRSLTITAKSRLVKIRLTKEFDEDNELDFKRIETALKGKFRMNDEMLSIIKHKAIVLIHALLEIQKDKALFNKLKSDIEYNNLKILIAEVYYKFAQKYRKTYTNDTLNHFDPKFLETLKPKQRERAKGIILETGFLALFLIFKLYNRKSEKNSNIQADLKLLTGKTLIYKCPKYVTSKILYEYEEHWKTEPIAKPETELDMSSSPPTYVEELFKEGSWFFYFYSSKVEILREGAIEELYFIRLPYTDYLADSEKDLFNHEVDRSTTLMKIRQLFDRTSYLKLLMQFSFNLKQINPVITLLFNYDHVYTLLSFCTAVLVNIMIILSFTSTNEKSFEANMYHPKLLDELEVSTTQLVIRLSGAILIFLGIKWVIFHTMHKVFMMMYSADYLTLIDPKLSRTRRVYNRVAYFLGHNVLYYSLYTAFAVLGVATHEFFFAFHLYEIMNQFKTCRIFIKSITDPYKQLLLAFVYYCFLIYAYSVIGYLFFWRYFVNTSDGPPADVQHYCNTLWMCFLTIYDQTNKEPGGIGSFLDFFGDLPVITNGYRVLFDVTFRFVIPIVMLSIVKGIIVDTFGALREKDQAQLDDKASRCFMCGLEKDAFDKIRTKTFADHIRDSHNMWDYVYFLIYIEQKRVTELTGDESYVLNNYLKKKLDWVPSKRCLDLDGNEKNTFIENLRDQLGHLDKKMEGVVTIYQQVSNELGKYVDEKKQREAVVKETHAAKKKILPALSQKASQINLNN